MKINLLTKRVVGFVFALSLLLGVGLTASSEANAQWQDPYWRQQREQQREQIRRQREWEREQRRRNRDDRRYDDRSYGGRYDPYNQGRYDQYGQYGAYANFRQTALNAGYNEGIKEGRKDRGRGQRYDFRDFRAYRNADTDYNSRYGNKALYQQYFRQGFQNGYADGLRGY